MNTTSPPAPDRPAPSERPVGVTRSIVGLALPPAAWIVQLLIAYGLSSNDCSSLQGRGGAALLANSGLETPVFLGVNLVALIVCMGGGVDSALTWRRMQADPRHAPLAGEGRARFIALCGMLAAIAFGVGILFNMVEPLMISHCWRVRA